MARLLHREIYKLKNEYPKFVISNINRIKLDPNRARDEATFGETVPTIVYDWYHGNISAGIQLFGGAPGARGLVIDVHGYSTHSSSAAKWTLLGKNNHEAFQFVSVRRKQTLFERLYAVVDHTQFLDVSSVVCGYGQLKCFLCALLFLW